MMIAILIGLCFLPLMAAGIDSPAWSNTPPSEKSVVILLGTGTPNPDPAHSGCSVAVLVGDTPYIVDFGPGLIRKAASLSPRYGGPYQALDVRKIKTAFLTHLHSDHTTGYADLILTPWVMGRDSPLVVYGPVGLQAMTRYLLKAYEDDIKYRLYGQEPANDQGWRVEVHEVGEGIIHEDAHVKVEAFKVNHGSWPTAFGFRFTTPNKKIVISGDTSPCENIIRYAKDADILVHEVYCDRTYRQRDKKWRDYHASHHTSTLELAEIAKAARPHQLVLYHILFWGATEADLLAEIRQKYSGKVAVGRDLAVYE